MFQNVNSKEVGLLVIVTLGSVIIFLVLVMLALLNIRLFVNKEQNSDLMKILKADENSEVTPIFTIDRNTSNNNLDEIEEILTEDDDQKDNSRNLLKQIKYCKTLFWIIKLTDDVCNTVYVDTKFGKVLKVLTPKKTSEEDIFHKLVSDAG